MSVRGNKKINFSLKMNDLGVIKEKENPSQLNANQNLKNQQFRLKTTVQMNSYINDNIYNRYLSFMFDKKYDNDTKPVINDNDDIKNVNGLELVLNYYYQQDKNRQEEIINDIFKMMKKSISN